MGKTKLVRWAISKMTDDSRFAICKKFFNTRRYEIIVIFEMAHLTNFVFSPYSVCPDCTASYPADQKGAWRPPDHLGRTFHSANPAPNLTNKAVRVSEFLPFGDLFI